jgi:hypothetical protein
MISTEMGKLVEDPAEIRDEFEIWPHTHMGLAWSPCVSECKTYPLVN